MLKCIVKIFYLILVRIKDFMLEKWLRFFFLSMRIFVNNFGYSFKIVFFLKI